MKETANKRKTTTLSCDESVRKFVAAEAERLGLSQREALARMVESYRHAQKRSATKAAEPQTPATPETIDMKVLTDALSNALSKTITKDVNRVIAFQKEQEKMFLTPIVRNVESIKTQLENLE